MKTFTIGKLTLPFSDVTIDNNERKVELAIGKYYLEKYANKRILEVGNVMQLYYPHLSYHVIVDKYEKYNNVINVDIVDFTSDTPFDLILSISTLEHVGYFSGNIQPKKILKAFNKIRSLLASGGEFVVTLPIGWAPESVEAHLDIFNFTEVYYMKRFSIEGTSWMEVSKEEALACKYGDPYINANSIIIGIIRSTE